MKYLRSVLSILAIFLVFSCVPSKIARREHPPEYPKLSDKEGREGISREEAIARAYEKADRGYREGRFRQAIEDFEGFISRFPSSDLVDDAFFKMGEIYFSAGDYDKSLSLFQKVMQDFPTSTIYNKARLKLAMSHLKLGNIQDSIQILKSMSSGPVGEEEKIKIHLLLGKNYEELSKNLVAISWYIRAMNISDNEESIEKIRDEVKRVINVHFSKNELLEIIYLYGSQFPSGYAEFKLAKVYFIEKELNEASLILVRMLNGHPEHEYRFQAQALLEEINQRLVTDVNAIGCILPLTGKYAAYGKKTLHGIELAAGVFSRSFEGSPIKLIIKDSEGDPEVAGNQVDELVLAANVICIIGPLLSVTAETAAIRAEELRIPMIVLSHKKDITQTGEYIFQNSLTPDLQTTTIVDYATETLELKRFVILYPDNNYGTDFMNLFWDKVLEHGGEIVGVESYLPDQNDFQNEIKKLVGLYYEDREDELEDTGVEGEELQPIIDFDAIFIPDYYDKVGLILPQLAYCDVVGTQLLGTSGWNSQQLIKMAREYAQGAVFVDGFFKGSPYPFVRKFLHEFRSIFDEEPGILEAQAYDSANMVIGLIKNQGIESRDGLREGLCELRDYPGVSGATSFKETGNSDKMLFVLTVKGGHIEQLR